MELWLNGRAFVQPGPELYLQHYLKTKTGKHTTLIRLYSIMLGPQDGSKGCRTSC